MMTEICEEELIKLSRELRKLFIISGANDQDPRTRYAYANQRISEAEYILDSKNNYPELLQLFAELEASCEKAETRRDTFRYTNERNGVNLD